MDNVLFIAKPATDHNMRSERANKTATTTPAIKNTTQINKFSSKTIFLNHTTHFFYKNRWRPLWHLQNRNKFIKFIDATITNSSCIHIFNRVRPQMSFGYTRQHLWLMLWLLLAQVHHVQLLEMTASHQQMKGTETLTTKLYSQLLSTNGQISMYDNTQNMHNDETFRPFVPKDPQLISRNVLTPFGQFHVFQPFHTDLSVAVSVQHSNQNYERNKMAARLNASIFPSYEVQQTTRYHRYAEQKVSNNLLQQRNQTEHDDKVRRIQVRSTKHEQEHVHRHQLKPTINTDDDGDVEQNEIYKEDDLTADWKNLEDLLVEYVTKFFQKGQYEPMPGLLVELQNNRSRLLSKPLADKARSVRQTTAATDAKIRIDLPRTLATGRVLFLTGLKKVLWPVFMGLQIMKSLLIAMFIPAIIGSFTRLLGKGISTGSAPLFIRPIEPPQELDFRDTSLNFDDDTKFLVNDMGIKPNGPYAYAQPDASQMNNEYVFDPATANNQLPYTRLGMNERQHQMMQDSYMNALQSIGSASFKNSGSLSSSSSGLLAPMAKRPPPAANVNTFQQFQNVPDSSLLLSNYDPFYSPLLSRLDSVFAQLKINSDKEICREKLICLMYANPAKYAPYSNLVSAQLSRELNELRKPTSDNSDILRFFKYMRAAKDGQDGVDCEKAFDKCTEFKDFDNPAMVSTYHDINKLVQARKFTNK